MASTMEDDGSTNEDFHDRCVWRDLFGKYLRMIDEVEGVIFLTNMQLSDDFNLGSIALIENLHAEYFRD